MSRRLLPLGCLLLSAFAGTTFAQDYSNIWNAAHRVLLGLDKSAPAQSVQQGAASTLNPDSPPNVADIQVFNPSSFWQSENSIGVNFSNPSEVMVSTNGQIPITPTVVQQTWAFSTDGGVTWPAGLQSESIPPNIVNCLGDPVAFFDRSSRAYYSTIGASGTSASGMYFVSTTDFGATWSARSNADPNNSSGDDKQHAAADYSGTFSNNVYCAWTDFNVTGAPVIFNRSTNQGQTWGTRQVLQIGANRGQGVHISIGPNGEVYLIWAHYTASGPEVGIGFAKSTDGGATFSTPVIAFPITGIREATPSSTWNLVRVNSFPYHDVDRSNGSRRGWIYVTYSDRSSGNSDIHLRRSSNGGATWSPAILVDDQPTGRQQFMPSIAVDPTTGGITISYYNMDSLGTNFMTNRYAAYSADGGDTWDRWVISDARAIWAPQGTPNTNTNYNGDYYETAAMGGKAWATWTDRRSGPTGASNRAYVERIVYGENFGWIQGSVTNVNGGASLEGVAIDFVENVLQQGATTNAAGFYLAGALVDTPATTANFTLRARKFGFLDTTLAVTLTRNDTVTRSFAMQPLDLVVTKSSITFPPTPVPGAKQDSLVARNQGTSSLTLSSLTTTNPDFSVSPTNGVIPAGDSLIIRVTYTPAAEGSDTGRVIILSNSVYTPRKDVVLSGTAVGVPVFTASVDSLVRTLDGGTRDSILFYMRNDGTGVGDFNARAIMFPQTGPNGAVGEPIVIPMIAQPRLVGSPSGNTNTLAGQMPELMYYKFNESGGTSTTNFAAPGVGTNPAPVTGQTMGGTGQFGSALIGTGVANNFVNTGWNTALGTGSWTISMWLNNLPSNTSLYYLWGDNTAASFRCFLGGAAGAGVITLRGTGITTVDVPGVAPGPTVVHFVYDASTSQITAYRNGGLVVTVPQSPLNLNGTSPFKVGAYSTSAGLPASGLMDEFRMYNRALSASEISVTWNTELGGSWLSVGPSTGLLAVGDSVLMVANFDATDPEVFNNPGNYFGQVEVEASNSPLADTLRIPARLFVQPGDTGILVVDPDSINFGIVPINADSTRSFTVRNIGALAVTVTNIIINDPNFSASPTSFTLGTLETRDVNVTFAAPAPANQYTGSLSFVSNAGSAQTVGLVGTSLGVPDFSAGLDSLTQDIEGGARDSILFYMRNNGTGTGAFSARAVMFPQTGPNRAAGKPIVVPVVIKPASAPPIAQLRVSDAISEGFDSSPNSDLSRGGTSTLGTPQYYNYNTGGSGNTFPFNITAGKRIQWLFLPGDFGQPSPAPQGRITTLHFRISTAGTGTYTDLSIMLGQTSLTELPAGNWYSGPMQQVYFRATVDLSAAVGEWLTIPLDVPFAFDPSQSLVIDINQCARVGTNLSTFHTGISGVRRNASLVGASCPLPFANTSTLVVHCGIDVNPGTWFSVAPTVGTIAVADSVLMKAYFDATDPEIYNNPGNYLGRLEVVATNSPLADTLRVPARLFVTPPPGARLTISADSLDFGDVEIDSSRTLSVLVRNIGASSLTVTGITMSNTAFAANPTNFTLASLDTQSVNVTFTAPSPGSTQLGTMQFVSNDPLAPSVGLRGRSVGVAHIVVQPDSFLFAISQGDSADGMLTIRNTGLGELTYTSRVNGGFIGEDSTEIGNSSLNLATSSGLIRGGVVQVTTSVQLQEIRTWLILTSSRELRYVVYENTGGTGFTLISETVVTSSGTGGPLWYSSGPINVTLEAGKRYAIGVSWPALAGLTYYWQASAPVPVPISFGTLTGGLAQTAFPPPATITQGASSSLYYTQLVTSSSQWLKTISGGTGTIASGDTALLAFRVYTDQLSLGNNLASLAILSNDPLAPTVTVPVSVDVVTGVSSAGAQIPETYELSQNYPNPFNPTTTIKFGLPRESMVKLTIYNILGQEVARLSDEVRGAGYFLATWDGTNEAGGKVSSGVYFYRLETTSVDGKARFVDLKKMILLK